MEKSIKFIQNQVKTLGTRVEELERILDRKNSQIEDLEEEIKDLEDLLSEARCDLQRADDQLEEQQNCWKPTKRFLEEVQRLICYGANAVDMHYMREEVRKFLEII